ncbi:cation:proton antiporter [Ostreibacterium oceani]|uniref:Cation:proton antiporter n=1 Tax=Ostreibacterium oceani TaxID=2654998 RepID=A0A6N7EVG1_9GAMM|nr:cation:proton antiporter [Ostreibacterium oceani]MPV85585.1 cation:proton antiporter [Ostreibacterium oceani]
MDWFFSTVNNPFFEFSAILAIAALLGILGQYLKQPLIVVFIALGIIVGPSVLDIVHSHEKIHLLAEIGIALLLFIVGLKLDLRIIKSVGKIALLTGLGQVIFTSFAGYVIAILLGFSSLHSLYIAVALTFSSTIIIVKLLSDKKEIDALHGQIAIGFLIVQDIVVILAMIVLSSMQQSDTVSLTTDMIKTLASGIGLLGFTVLISKIVIPKVSHLAAKSQELLVLFAIAWAVSLASIGEAIGFSREVGAFLAGVSLASTAYRDTISLRLTSLRDFLLLFFFVHLGATLNLSLIGGQLSAALLLSTFVLIGNPLIVLIIMGVMGYKKRTSFLAGLTVAQISEFSLIFASLGLSLGHISDEVVGLITLVGLITIGLSTYLILYSHQIYHAISPVLSIFERQHCIEPECFDKHSGQYDIIIFGLGRFGDRLADRLDEHPSIRYLGVDFDPNAIKAWREKGRQVIYGDMEDAELFEEIPFKSSAYIISTIPDIERSLSLINALKESDYSGEVFVTALTEKDHIKMQHNKVKNILRPHQMAAAYFYEFYIKNK